MLIFLIEDDEALAEGISFMLEKEGYATAAGLLNKLSRI